MSDRYYYTDMELEDADPKEDSEFCVAPVKFVYYLFEVIMFITAVGLLYYCISIRLTITGPTHADSLMIGLLNFGIISGVLMLGFAVFGMTAVGLKSQAMGTAYIAMIIVAIFASIGCTWWIQFKIAELKPELSSTWDSLAEGTKALMQDVGECCGFSGPGDRAVEPCPIGAIGGCFPKEMASPVLSWLRGGLLFAMSSVFSLGMILSILIIFILFIHEPSRFSAANRSRV